MQSDNISSLGAAIGGGGHIDELSTAIKVALDRKGILKDVKARIRAEVFHALEDKTVGIQEQQPEELMIASELVREFLSNMQYGNTLSVFAEEAGQPSQMYVDRPSIASELGINITSAEENEQVPLLLLLVQYLKKVKDKYEEELYSSLLVEAET